ncbi:YceI family protein [Terriglobus albidus]|uniref:YceI family protein n=1 Tax=Terriglobus albidus TaxID=1592106 RepID=UPI0021DFFA63|nr:YceI family protein [Terriglobus albidus]
MFRKPTLLLAGLLTFASAAIHAQMPGPGGPGGPQQPPPPPTPGAKLDVITEGSSASYRVTEQFVGVAFTNEAIGTTNLVSGTLIIKADGTVDPSSKITVDLRGLKSDQDQRDGFVQNRTLETAKYPTAEFVPTKVTGLDKLIPSAGQAGIALTGNLTIHGVTKEVTFQGIATFNPRDNMVAGRAKTILTFDQFGLNPPKIGRLASVENKIDLELAYRFKRSLP